MKRLLFILLTIGIIGCNTEEKVPNQPEQDNADAIRQPKDLSMATIYSTVKDTDLRLAQTSTHEFDQADQPLETELSLFVNPNKTFQSFMGIGAAITDASAETFAKLSEEKQEEFLRAYFTDEGIGYSLIRTPIHSCDFSSGSYTYIDEGDQELSTFSIHHDLEYKVPMIKRSIEAAGGELLTYASPWSPPAFMKTNNNMLQGGSLLPEYYDAWALYFAKFIKEYEAIDIPIWGVTIQNEPMAKQRWSTLR